MMITKSLLIIIVSFMAAFIAFVPWFAILHSWNVRRFRGDAGLVAICFLFIVIELAMLADWLLGW